MKSKWTLEKLQEEANKYETRSDLMYGNYAAYQAAKRLNLMDVVCKHMPLRVTQSGDNNSNFKWTKELILLESLKYEIKSNFIKYSYGAYKAAIRLNILTEVCLHMKKQILIGDSNPNYKWTLEKLQEEANKYESKSDFYKNSPDAYNAAYNQQILSKICNKLKQNIRWTKETATKEALKFNNITEFHKHAGGAFNLLSKLKILDSVTAHMQRLIGESKPEKELFEVIQKNYPTVKKLRIRKIKIKKRPYIYGFDIDIFVPELNMGIEFDGTYHHSFEGLKRAKPNWPRNAIKNYHKIKDSYFLTKNIKILHIKEKDWIKNKELCIKKCLIFLDKHRYELV